MIWSLHGAVGHESDLRNFANAMHESAPAKLDVRRLKLWQYLACCPMPLKKFATQLSADVARMDNSPQLMGYSLGGRLALHALLDSPDLWQSAVIVSAHTGLSDPAARLERQKTDAEWASKALRSEWDEFLTEWKNQSVLAGVELPDRYRLKAERNEIARSFMDWSLGAQDDLLERLGDLQMPILWVVGERDEKFLRVAEKACAALPNGQLEVVADCGHRVPWEQAEIFHKLAGDFFQTTKSQT